MNTYEAYKNKEFDLSAFGLNRYGDDYAYFCTPVGADVFASPGVDGILEKDVCLPEHEHRQYPHGGTGTGTEVPAENGQQENEQKKVYTN